MFSSPHYINGRVTGELRIHFPHTLTANEPPGSKVPPLEALIFARYSRFSGLHVLRVGISMVRASSTAKGLECMNKAVDYTVASNARLEYQGERWAAFPLAAKRTGDGYDQRHKCYSSRCQHQGQLVLRRLPISKPTLRMRCPWGQQVLRAPVMLSASP